MVLTCSLTISTLNLETRLLCIKVLMIMHFARVKKKLHTECQLYLELRKQKKLLKNFLKIRRIECLSCPSREEFRDLSRRTRIPSSHSKTKNRKI